MTEDTVSRSIDQASPSLRDLSIKIHENPELTYAEHKAHSEICNFLTRLDLNLTVTPKAYGLDTSFLAEYGQGGRLVTFCAEYDALPEIGHGCGHNLITVTSIAAFLAAVTALKESNSPGRVRLLGCPAEEGGGGKVKLVNAGAFTETDAALMSHPLSHLPHISTRSAGVAYGTCLAAVGFSAKFHGKPTHAGQTPWLGLNALDATALTYSAVGLLRQHIKPTDRINIILSDGGTATNIIPDKGTIKCTVRSATLSDMQSLQTKVENCCRGAALATWCTVDMVPDMDAYADMRPNESLGSEFTRYMGTIGREYYCDLQLKEVGTFSTDMGNVSYEVPSFHGLHFIPTPSGTGMHTEEFRDAAKTEASHDVCMDVAKGLAVAGLRVLFDDEFAAQMKADFEQDKKLREISCF